MKEINCGNVVIYQNPEEKVEGKIPKINITLHKVVEVKNDTFKVEGMNDELKKYRVKYIIPSKGEKHIEYEGFDMQKIAIEEGYLDPQLLEEIKTQKRKLESAFNFKFDD